MEWIYLSPHFDDIAYSCGGLVWEQVNSGQMVSIWTICAAYPPPGPLSSFASILHERWGTGREAITRLSAKRIDKRVKLYYNITRNKLQNHRSQHIAQQY